MPLRFAAVFSLSLLSTSAFAVPIFMEKSKPETTQPQIAQTQQHEQFGVIRHQNNTSVSTETLDALLLDESVTPTIIIEPETYLKNQIFTKAAEEYSQQPRTRDVLLNLAKAQLGENKPEQAIRTLQPLLNEYLPEARELHGNILLHIAETAYLDGDNKKAKNYINLYEKDYGTENRNTHSGLKRFHRLSEQLGLIKRTPVQKNWFWGDATTSPETAKEEKEFFRVGVLLPLSGPLAQVGQDILRGMQLSLFSQQNTDTNVMTLLYPQDTEGTPEGAAAAAQRAIKLGANVIIGPLAANNSEAANKVAMRRDIPVLSFSSTSAIATPNLHLLGYTPQEQARAAARAAIEQGRYRVAALVPSTEYGYEVLAAFTDELQKFGLKLQDTAFYNPQNADVQSALTSLLKLDESRKALQKEKAALEELHDELGDIMPEEDFQRLQVLKKAKPEATVDFDALFLPATTTGLRLITSQMATYDADKADILYLGTASWNAAELQTIKAEYVNNGLFFGPKENLAFLKNFQHAYKSQPHPLAQLGYDAANIAQNIAIEVHHGNFTPTETLLRPEGFSTLSGPIKFVENGKTKRLYNEYLLNNKGISLVESHQQLFPPLFDIYTNHPPRIQMPTFDNTNRFLPF